MTKPTGHRFPLDLVRAGALVAVSNARALSRVTRGDPVVRVQRTLDGAIGTYNSDPQTGLVDPAAVNAFIGIRQLKRIAISAPPFSDIIALDNAAGINVGMAVAGPGIGYGAVVLDVSAAPNVKLSQRPALSVSTELTFTDIGGIHTRFDQSGNGNHAIQLDIAQQPVWEPDMGNGRPGMSTNTKFSPQERGGFLATANSVTIPAGKLTLFAVTASEDTGYGSLTPIMGINGLDNGPGGIFSVYLAANWSGHSNISNVLYDLNAYGEWQSADFGKLAYETADVLNLVFDSQGGSSSFLNGTAYPYAGDNLPMGPVSGRLAIGSQDASLFSNSFKGDLGDVILYGDAILQQDCAAVRKDLAAFYTGS